MAGWPTYLLRSVLHRFGVKPSPKAFADKHIIAGLTCLDENGALIEQFQVHGRVVAASSAGIVLIRPDGGQFVLPPSPDWLKPARPGEYRLRANRDVVVDPDYLFSATLRATTLERVANLKKYGFEGGFGG